MIANNEINEYYYSITSKYSLPPVSNKRSWAGIEVKNAITGENCEITKIVGNSKKGFKVCLNSGKIFYIEAFVKLYRVEG